jgi:hypothetical protein
MATQHPLLVEDRVAILVEFLGNFAARIPNPDRAAIVEGIHSKDDRMAARTLQERLDEYGIPLKHMHGLQLAAKLSGRRGMNHPLPLIDQGPPTVSLHIFDGNAAFERSGRDEREFETALVEGGCRVRETTRARTLASQVQR